MELTFFSRVLGDQDAHSYVVPAASPHDSFLCLTRLERSWEVPWGALPARTYKSRPLDDGKGKACRATAGAIGPVPRASGTYNLHAAPAYRSWARRYER